MRVLLATLFLLPLRLAASDMCEIHASKGVRVALGMLRLGYKWKLLTHEEIAQFARGSIWTNPFHDQSRLLDGLSIKQGFDELEGKLTDAEKVQTQKEAATLAVELEKGQDLVKAASEETKLILAPRIGRRLDLGAYNVGNLRTVAPLGTYENRPVFQAVYNLGTSENGIQFFIDPMNSNSTREAVMTHSDFSLEHNEAGYTRAGLVRSEKGFVLHKTSNTFDLGKGAFAEDFKLHPLGRSGLIDFFIESFDGKERLFATRIDSANPESLGLLEFDLSQPENFPRIHHPGKVARLRRDWVNGDLYVSGIFWEEKKIVVVRVRTGQKYEIPLRRLPEHRDDYLVYEDGGAIKLIYANKVNVIGGLVKEFFTTSLEAPQLMDFAQLPALTSTFQFIRIHDEPFIYFYDDKDIVFKNLRTKDENRFENMFYYTLEPFVWKNELFFLLVGPGGKLQIIDYAAKSILAVPKAGVIFTAALPFEFQGQLYALAMNNIGSPYLVHLTLGEVK